MTEKNNTPFIHFVLTYLISHLLNINFFKPFHWALARCPIPSFPN